MFEKQKHKMLNIGWKAKQKYDKAKKIYQALQKFEQIYNNLTDRQKRDKWIITEVITDIILDIGEMWDEDAIGEFTDWGEEIANKLMRYWRIHRIKEVLKI